MAVCTQEIHQNDIGTIFRVTIYNGTPILDVSGATTKQILFQKPDGTAVTQTAAFFTDGTDGIIQYTTISGDLDQVGRWKLQAKVTLATGTWTSCSQKFKVNSVIA